MVQGMEVLIQEIYISAATPRWEVTISVVQGGYHQDACPSKVFIQGQSRELNAYGTGRKTSDKHSGIR